MRNRKVKTQLKNEVKKMRLSAADTSQEITADQLNAVKSTIAKAGKKGVIHKKTAARKISRLSKLVNSVKA